MKTKELFRDDVYMKEAQGTVISVTEKDGKTLVVLDQTLFFPEGGGQTCDLGTIDGKNVLDVYLFDKTIYHQVDAPLDAFKEGMAVTMAIDWERRFDNMQRHCGEHILTGIFYKLYGGINRGFHMGDDYMTIDISLEEDPSFTSVTWDMAKEAELKANQVIWENLPMVTQHFDTLQEASKVPVRKKVAIEEDITLVGIGSKDAGWGTCACCGTHPAHTGDVGLIKVFKVESNKGMWRIYFEAGQRAFKKYQFELDVLHALGNKLSAGPEDLLMKYEGQQDKVKDIRNHLHDLTKYVCEKEVKELSSALETVSLGEAVIDSQGEVENTSSAEAKCGSRPVFAKEYDALSIDDLLNIGRSLIPDIKSLLCLVHVPTNTVLLFSDGKVDCGKLVKENASIYNGKGGGNDTSARAIFTKKEYVDTFIDLLDKHLR